MDQIRIRMMGGFAIYVNEIRMDQITEKTRKGAALMQMLIVDDGRLVQSSHLISSLWSDEVSANPENALKTLVSRLRATLNTISPELGKCIGSDRGGYYWAGGENVSVDLHTINRLLSRIDATAEEEERLELYHDFVEAYMGDLLDGVAMNEWAQGMSTALHTRYLQTVYRYVDALKERNDDMGIVNLCRTALEVDTYDETIHLELMDALVRMDRTNEAMLQYKTVINLYYRDLGIRPGEKLLSYYKYIISNGKNLEFSLESIRTELCESSVGKGAFVCEYGVFKEIYNLQMRNLERLGSTMFLGLIQIRDTNDDENATPDPLKQDHYMRLLMDVLRHCLRKGDTVSQFSTDVVSLLLPMVHYESGKKVMERVKREFYKQVPHSNVVFSYSIGPLSSSEKNSQKN